MKQIHQRDVIREVRARWTDQYKNYPDDRRIGLSDPEPLGVIRPRIAALDLETCTVADVDAAIGVTGWADLKCDECGKSVPLLIRFGSEPDYDARWQDLCPACLSQAVAMLNRVKPLP